MKAHPWIDELRAGGTDVSERAAERASKVTKLAREENSVVALDTGCGEGLILRAYESAGMWSENIYGCDIEPGHVELSRRYSSCENIELCDFAVPTDVFPGVRFDMITAFEWLHNDWKHKHAVEIPAAERARNMADFHAAVVDNVVKRMRVGGLFVFDLVNSNTWKQEAAYSGLAFMMAGRGFEEVWKDGWDFIVWRRRCSFNG